MGIYDDKVEQIDLKGQLKPFNINQLDRVMHILGQRRLGLDTSSIPTDEIPKTHMQVSLQIEWSTPPLLSNLICFRSTKTLSMMVTCSWQNRGPECMRTGPK